MRKIPGDDNNDSNYQSMTANDLIVLLNNIDPHTVIMSWDGNVILHFKYDKNTKEIVYLTHEL